MFLGALVLFVYRWKHNLLMLDDFEARSLGLNIARILYGSNTASVMPLSLFVGAIFMLLIDTMSRSISAEEIPLSILSSIIGALIFVLILYRSKGGMKL